MFKEIHFPTIPSTHTYALDHIHEYKEQYTFISAAKQTGGIGRKGDVWLSEGENLLATFIFPKPKKDVENLAQLLCFSAIKVLEKLALVPRFKWPNDILLSHKKVGGVMSDIKENVVIISIGMNVNMNKTSLDKIKIPATSLSEELLDQTSLLNLKEELLSQFSLDLTLFEKEGFAPFFQPFAAKLAFIGKLAAANGITGHIAGLNSDGRLIVKSNGEKVLLTTSSLEIIE